MSNMVTFEKKDGIGIVTVDNPPVNVICQEMRAGLVDAFAQLNADDDVNAIVITCAGKSWMAGADVKEFDNPIEDPSYYETLGKIEASDKPVVAALKGMGLGGGVELALACHYRVADSKTRLGFPEISLGIVPGAGGTQRLPRLVGATKALDMMLSGRPVDAKSALDMGLVDRVEDGSADEAAVTFAKSLVAEGKGPRRTGEMDVDTTGWSDEYLAQARKNANKFWRGQETIEKQIEAVSLALELPLDEGFKKESELSVASLKSEESKALRHIFFAEREVTKIPGLSKDVKPQAINKVAIIGSGTMGGGIAMNFSNIGVPVTMVDVSDEALERGLGIIRKNYERTAKKGRITMDDVEKRMGLINGTTDYADLKDCDLVIEAVFENMDLKKKIFKQLDEVCKPETILATNTSTLDINEIAEETSRPDKVVGLHFFSPANVMKLVEIVRPAKISDETLATAVDIAKKIKKVGVVVGVCFGFVGNRMMLEGYVREADQLLLEGATPEQVDRVIYDFGFAMGPFAMNDMAGLDVAYKIRETTGAWDKYPAPYHNVIDALARMGRYGQKTGAGLYKYEEGDRTPHHDPVTDEVIEEEAKKLGIERREISDEEVLKRCVYALINEGAKILEEGIAYRSSDIDVIYCFGYGFPRRWGGPMYYADMVGVKNVYEDVKRYHEQFGHYWEPAPLLKQLAESGGTFTDWKPE